MAASQGFQGGYVGHGAAADHAAAWQVEVREVQGRGLGCLYWGLYLGFAVLLALGLVGLLGLVPMGLLAGALTDPQGQSLLIVVPAALVLLVLAGLTWAAAQARLRARTRVKAVRSLLPSVHGEFVLSDEGVYAPIRQPRNRNPRQRCVRLHPWTALRAGVADPKHNTIVLQDGVSLLKLKAAAGDHALMDAILAHLPEGRQAAFAKPAGFRWGVLLAGVAIVAVVGVVGATSFAGLSTGKVGDNLCDVCGASLSTSVSQPVTSMHVEPFIADPRGPQYPGQQYVPVWTTRWYPVKVWDEGYYVRQGGTLIHEYCPLHGAVYSLAHPEQAISLFSSASPGELMQALESVCWLFVLLGCLFAVIAIAQPTWQRAPALRQ